MTTALERWALASNLRHKENLLLLLFVWFLCLQRVHNVVNTTWNDQSSSAAVWLCSSHYKVEHTYDKTRWHAYIRRHKVTHIPTDDEKMFIFLTDTRLPVLSPRVPRERALLSAPVTHTPPIHPAAMRSTIENGAVWEMEAIYNCRIRTQPLSQLTPHSETKREPLLHANVTQLPFNRSDKRRVGGRSDIKSKLSQVIESSHWERAPARRLSRVCLWGRWRLRGVCLCVWLEMITDC